MELRSVCKLIDECADEDVFVIGCGPSLQEFSFDSLSGKNVIALNRAITYFSAANPPTFGLWHDSYLWNEVIEWPIHSKTRMVTAYERMQAVLEHKDVEWKDRTYCYRRGKPDLGRNSVGRRDDMFPEGPTIACAALWLAWRLGAKRVFLLGVDGYWTRERYYAHIDKNNRECQHMVGETHCAGGWKFYDARADKWSRAMWIVIQYVRQSGMWCGKWPEGGVYNLSQHSLITRIEKIPMEHIL